MDGTMSLRHVADQLATAVAMLGRARDASLDPTAKALLASAYEDARQALETTEDVAIRDHLMTPQDHVLLFLEASGQPASVGLIRIGCDLSVATTLAALRELQASGEARLTADGWVRIPGQPRPGPAGSGVEPIS